MVELQRMAVAAIERTKSIFSDRPPRWAVELGWKIDILLRKVNLIMALDTSVLNRILAGAASLVEQAKAAAEREKAKDARIAELEAALASTESTLASERSADAAEDADANKALTDTAAAMDTLLQGPETPTVETPAPSDAPAVIEGSQDPVVVDPGPSADTGESGEVNTEPPADPVGTTDSEPPQPSA